MYPGDDQLDPNTIPRMDHDYVTAMLKGRVCEFALKGGSAQSGELTTLWDGSRPEHGHFSPMRKQVSDSHTAPTGQLLQLLRHVSCQPDH